jgi:hypothetical protein
MLFFGAAFADTPEGGGTAGVTLTVTPSDNLTANQTVHLTGTGWGIPGPSASILLCDAGPVHCRESNLNGQQLPISPEGTITTDVSVPTSFTTPQAQTVNCLTTQCFLRASATNGRAAQHHVSFQGGITSTSSSSTSTSSPTSTSTTSTSSSSTTSTTTATATAITVGSLAQAAVATPRPLVRTGSASRRLAVIGVAFVLLGLAIDLTGRVGQTERETPTPWSES